MTAPTLTLDSAMDDLRSRVSGEVLMPADAGYDAAKAGFNTRFDQRPGIVVVAHDAADVAEAVRASAALGLDVTVHATGHGTARVSRGGMMIVTSRMNGVRIDGATARVEAGARWSDVLPLAQERGLAPLTGSTTHVGAVGYTLGGGMGWLGRQHGLCSDSVLSFDLVTPAGLELRASADENAEVFWALKGGGAGSLGVVTAMEIRLYPVTEVYAGNLFYPASTAREIALRWREQVADADERLTSSLVLMNFPPLEDVPELLRGQSFVLIRGCWNGDLEEGAKLIDEWRRWRTPVLDLFGPMRFAASDVISMDPTGPMPSFVTSEWMESLHANAIDILVEATLPGPGHQPTLLMTEVRHAGGEIRRGAAGAANDLGRTGEFLLEMVGVPPFPHAATWLEAHLRLTREKLRPYVTGAAAVNFLDGEEKSRRSATAFSREHRDRLARVKEALDPDGRFGLGVQFDVITRT